MTDTSTDLQELTDVIEAATDLLELAQYRRQRLTEALAELTPAQREVFEDLVKDAVHAMSMEAFRGVRAAFAVMGRLEANPDSERDCRSALNDARRVLLSTAGGLAVELFGADAAVVAELLSQPGAEDD